MKLLPEKEFLNSLPKKRSASDVLFFNQMGEVMIVKPNYKKCWLVPGGIVELNESPYQAARREVNEELGLELKKLKLIAVEYQSSKKDFIEAYKFIFNGGMLTNSQINKIKLQAEELVDYKFIAIKKALPLLSPGIRSRLPNCIKAINENKGIVYLENGKMI